MKDLHTLIAEHFKIAPNDIADEVSAKDIPEWDSMNYLLFIADVEKEYSVSFSMDEVLGIESVGDIKKILKAKSVEL